MIFYLACPYSHKDPSVSEARFKAVNKAAAKLMHAGFHIFSPISHTHPIAIEGSLPTDFSFWAEYDEAILRMCGALIVLRLPGWSDSHGVTKEMAIAARMGKPILFIDP